jgi:hypothetical protein
MATIVRGKTVQGLSDWIKTASATRTANVQIYKLLMKMASVKTIAIWVRHGIKSWKSVIFQTFALREAILILKGTALKGVIKKLVFTKMIRVNAK